MKTFFAQLIIVCLLSSPLFSFQSFLSRQLEHERVRTAVEEKNTIVEQTLRRHGMNTSSLHVLFVAYKKEQLLDLYAKRKNDSSYTLVQSYPICSLSGTLGPKRQEGDRQVPEGFYSINMFNPNSSFYLSLGINYPNESDRKKSSGKNPGSAIFIHGDCVTIGCLPMTTDKIKEIYLYAVHARNNGQKTIPVYIFPFRMTDDAIHQVFSSNDVSNDFRNFWSTLKSGFDQFMKSKRELTIHVDRNGNYRIGQPGK